MNDGNKKGINKQAHKQNIHLITMGQTIGYWKGSLRNNWTKWEKQDPFNEVISSNGT